MNVQVAQINIGTMVAATDDPAVAEFMDNLERVNAIADAAPGFVWRLQTDSGNATEIQIFPNPLTLVNMSVWESVEALKEYVYRSDHIDFFRRRAEWFEPDAKRVALWHVVPGMLPQLDEAVRRVAFLERNGASPYAFGFAKPPVPLVFEETTPDDGATAELIGRLNHELAVIATHPNENHFRLTTDEVTGDRGRMVRARYGGQLVGCGAVRTIGDGVGEIKRMFVDPSVRGEKIGAAILDQLELHARRLGLRELRLETSAKQQPALRLYEGFGFTPHEQWGEYLDSPDTSLCFAKQLDDPAQPSASDTRAAASTTSGPNRGPG
jgi:GNAT superfamily N-acetyltransferase